MPRPAPIPALTILLVLVLACTPFASAAQAATPAAPGLNWLRLEGADGCISAAQLAQAVEARVGRVLFVPASSAALFVDGSVRLREPEHWQVELGISDADGRVLGRRSLEIRG